MTVDQYISQKRQLGLPIHQWRGVWWERHKPFYYKPAFARTVLAKGSANPMPARALVGYSHVVASATEANAVWRFMERRWDQEKAFDLADITSKKRNQVRKGLKICEVKPIECLDGLWLDMQRVNISHSKRTGCGKPAKYHTDRYREWSSYIARLHALQSRQWFGAFVEGRLASYFYGYAVGWTYIIDAAKTDSDFLWANPNDALLFTMLEHAYNKEGCDLVVYGGHAPGDDSLAAFKMKYGFEISAYPVNLCLRLPFRQLARFLGRPGGSRVGRELHVPGLGA